MEAPKARIDQMATFDANWEEMQRKQKSGSIDYNDYRAGCLMETPACMNIGCEVCRYYLPPEEVSAEEILEAIEEPERAVTPEEAVEFGTDLQLTLDALHTISLLVNNLAGAFIELARRTAVHHHSQNARITKLEKKNNDPS